MNKILNLSFSTHTILSFILFFVGMSIDSCIIGAYCLISGFVSFFACMAYDDSPLDSSCLI